MKCVLLLECLATRPELAPVLAHWHVGAFASWLGGWSEADALRELLSHGNPNVAPCTWLALADGVPVGSISLLREDPPAPPGQGPWLASFYVLPEWRGRGVGGRLHDHCLREAHRFGESTVRLWTPDSRAFYAKRGWRTTGRMRAHGLESHLMEMILATWVPRESPPA